MKARPILFSGPMIRALLAGTKTQTRRVVKPQPYVANVIDGTTYWNVSGQVGGRIMLGQDFIASCPYGQPGDLLWVRETFRIGNDVGENWDDSSEPGDLHVIYEDGARDYNVPIDYWNDIPRNAREVHNSENTPEHWISYGPIPSIFMPRWASRLTLLITEVRVQRLQDINAEDCWAEGMPFSPDVNPIHDYEETWESINGAGSWDANPWCWALSFEVIKKNVDQVLAMKETA